MVLRLLCWCGVLDFDICDRYGYIIKALEVMPEKEEIEAKIASL